MKRIYNQKTLSLIMFLILCFSTHYISAQITIAPLSCYPQYASASEMDAAAATGGTTPFATWKGAYDYAVANAVTTIDFVPGTYATDLSGFRSDWGDADGGFVLPAGMTVNGNGAVIDNAPVGSSQICFATLSSNSTVNGLVFKQLSGNPNGGALFVPSSADNWTINNCEFFNSNQGTDAVVVNMGASSTGNITGCSFYGNSNPGAVYPESPGLPSSSALDISGSLTSDLNITNTSFSCNFRNVSGGAVKIQDDVHVDFDGCTFYRNEANSSEGGAVDIGSNAVVLFNNTSFIENFTSGSGSRSGGALALESGSTVTITGCNFRLNTALDNGGAIYMSGQSSNTTTVNISGTIFEENFVSGGLDGGVLYVSNYTDVNIDNCLFLNNTAGDKGAAIWVSGTSTKDLDILNSTFVNNNAGSGEATIHVGYLDTDTDVYIDNCVICDNNSAEDIESEYITALTTVNDSYWDNDKGTINFTGTNTNPYVPSYDADWNEVSGAGWTGTYTQVSGSGSCPTPPAPADNCADQGSISGVAFDDSDDEDGINSGARLAGVLVELFTCGGGSTGKSITTDASGEFYFGGLDNGSCYYLVFTAPASFELTTENAGGSNSMNDSDVSTATGQSAQITIDTSPNSVDDEDDTSNETHYITLDAGFKSASLPIELFVFNLIEKDCKVIVQWETASELNNSYFEIQRSTDGEKYDAIYHLDATPDNIEGAFYQMIDEQPNKQNYYRLKQVDIDGTTSFFRAAYIDLSCGKNSWGTSITPTLVYNDKAVLTLTSPVQSSFDVAIYSSNGRLLQQLNADVFEQTQTLDLDFSRYTSGLYLIKISNQREVNIHKIQLVK